jgi:hypothetical protein
MRPRKKKKGWHRLTVNETAAMVLREWPGLYTHAKGDKCYLHPDTGETTKGTKRKKIDQEQGNQGEHMFTPQYSRTTSITCS